MLEVFPGVAQTIVQDDIVRGVFGNRLLGNVDRRFSSPEEVEMNRLHILGTLVGHQAITPSKLVVMAPIGRPGFFDLHGVQDVEALPDTDGLITTDPSVVLSGNPADCEMLAMYGHGDKGPVLGLIHVGRVIASHNGHGAALTYLTEHFGLKPRHTRVIFAPSIRVESYKFPTIDEQQKIDPGWVNYVYQDGEGLWHVDVHGKVVDELQTQGVEPEHMFESPIDVGAHPDYFSYRQQVERGQQPGRNAVMFRLLDQG